MGYIGMCGAKGYGFSAALVINRVSVLAILVITKGKLQIVVISRVRVLGSGPHTPIQFFWEYPPPPWGGGGQNLWESV